MPQQALQIGLLVESSEQLNSLRQLVIESGHQVACSMVVSEFEQLHSGFELLDIDTWLVTVTFERDDSSAENLESEASAPESLQALEAIESWLAHLQKPVIIDDGLHASRLDEGYQAWRRRVLKKLQQLRGSINLEQHPAGAANRVWVLAASTGGPEAVREFFQALPEKLDLGFVYVQHMDAGYEQSLADIVNRHSHYPAYPVVHGDIIHPNRTAIIANDCCVEFVENGSLVVKTSPWPGPYSPSVDQVFANIARSFGSRCGVIVFSGMGDDGANGVRLVHQQGGQVWAQSPDSCTIDAMPKAALETQVVSKTGTPKQLAQYLTVYARGQARTN
ncbi:MAG: chemotaxis protein CheB [Cellvibrionaceae bacterium]